MMRSNNIVAAIVCFSISGAVAADAQTLIPPIGGPPSVQAVEEQCGSTFLLTTRDFQAGPAYLLKGLNAESILSPNESVSGIKELQGRCWINSKSWTSGGNSSASRVYLFNGLRAQPFGSGNEKIDGIIEKDKRLFFESGWSGSPHQVLELRNDKLEPIAPTLASTIVSFQFLKGAIWVKTGVGTMSELTLGGAYRLRDQWGNTFIMPPQHYWAAPGPALLSAGLACAWVFLLGLGPPQQ